MERLLSQEASMFVDTTSRFPVLTHSRGFSLVELVTSIVILAVLSAAAIPRFFNDQSVSERGYADEVASALRYSQRIALASGCEVNFQFNTAGYTATQRSSLANCDSKSGAWSTQVRRGDGSLLRGTPPGGISSSATAAFVFRDDGSLFAAAAPLQIGIFTVTVDQHTGTVAVAR